MTAARWPPSCLMVLERPYWLTGFSQLWGLLPSRGGETFQSENRQLTGLEVAINGGAGGILAEVLFSPSFM